MIRLGIQLEAKEPSETSCVSYDDPPLLELSFEPSLVQGETSASCESRTELLSPRPRSSYQQEAYSTRNSPNSSQLLTPSHMRLIHLCAFTALPSSSPSQHSLNLLNPSPPSSPLPAAAAVEAPTPASSVNPEAQAIRRQRSSLEVVIRWLSEWEQRRSEAREGKVSKVKV